MFFSLSAPREKLRRMQEVLAAEDHTEATGPYVELARAKGLTPLIRSGDWSHPSFENLGSLVLFACSFDAHNPTASFSDFDACLCACLCVGLCACGRCFGREQSGLRSAGPCHQQRAPLLDPGAAGHSQAPLPTGTCTWN